jgi:hypothetical protein
MNAKNLHVTLVELKKVINPDTKHTFTTYSLVFSKESNLSSGTGLSGKRENAN